MKVSTSKALSSNNGLSCFALPSISTITIYNGVISNFSKSKSDRVTALHCSYVMQYISSLIQLALHLFITLCKALVYIPTFPAGLIVSTFHSVSLCATSITVGLPNMLSNSRPQLNTDPWTMLSCFSLIPHLPCTVSVCSTWLFMKPRLRSFNSLQMQTE